MPADFSIVSRYFPELSPLQESRFKALEELYTYWNARINLISRKDESSLYERHVLHSLGIAKVIRFKPGTRILDVGTGGGFPGIPLAILFPETAFLLIDSIGKKINVVKEVVASLKLTNVKAEQIRAEQYHTEQPGDKFDFVVSRAVADMSEFENWVGSLLKRKNENELSNGILYLKGGDLTQELNPFEGRYRLYSLSDFFKEEFFETKKLVYLPAVDGK